MILSTPISDLHRIGKTLAARLKRLGIVTVRDLLYFFPFRYEDYSHVVRIAELSAGTEVTICAQIEMIAAKRSPRKRTLITEAVVSDDTGQLRIIWFGQPFIAKQLKQGDRVYLSGGVKEDMFGMSMVSPAYEKAASSPVHSCTSAPVHNVIHTARIVPMYPLTQGLTQKQMRFLMNQAIDLVSEIPEWLPEDIRDRADVMEIHEAIRQMHFPDDARSLQHAERRMKFDEVFLLQLRAVLSRRSRTLHPAPRIVFHEAETKAFVAALPFSFTKAQKVAAWEIVKDMEKNMPMNRLLEGDVGSGKTVVAALVAYNAVLSGYQVAIMAPTEILAAQHYASFASFLSKNIRIALVSRAAKEVRGDSEEIRGDNVEINGDSEEIERDVIEKKGEKKNISQYISTYLNISPDRGGIAIVIGTHALLSEKITFNNLGLVIVDEQHRFGVAQRKTLKEKMEQSGTVPHFLSMTATPIPRSFALALYGDLDISIINEMPAGRKPVKTRLVDLHNRGKAYAFIREQVKQGRQGFVVCPVIGNQPETMEHRTWNMEHGQMFVHEKKTVMAEYEKLSKMVFPDLRVGFLHGKMPIKEKDNIMEQFRQGVIDILVSTSVVEVGVDVPNASVMMIEGAEGFGLAQLHQFRGRVGRSKYQSYCFLFTDSDSEKVQERLSFFEKNTDGFKVAEYDLEQRGPGEVYGTMQSGLSELRFATMKDGALIKLAREIAEDIDFEKYPTVKERVREWESVVHLE